MKPKIKASAEEAHKKKRKNRSKAVKFIWTVIKILTVFMIVLCFALAGVVGGAIVGAIRTAPPITDDQLQLKALTTRIYDSKGNEIAKLTGSDNTDRIIVLDENGQIPEHLKNAFIALEDERFPEHNGFDVKGFIRAVFNTLTNNQQGGSTITMQVVRNITNDKEDTPQRKIREIWRAMELERRLPKWQILQLYLNVIPMGGNSYGVQSASLKYFGKPVKDLSLAQCATLAAITQLPNKYAPIDEEGRKANRGRMLICLKKMLEQGYISQKEYDEAVKEDIQFIDLETEVANNMVVRSYFVDEVIMQVKEDLMAVGYSEQMATMLLFNGGLNIYTTMDPDIQGAMDEVFLDEENNFPGKEVNGKLPQAAMVIIDPSNGHVKAMYGGRGEKTKNLVLNRATQAKRSTGSTMKPIAVYGPAIDQRMISGATVIDDVPVHLDSQNRNRLYPKNDNNLYNGLISVRRAVEKSVNVVAAKVFMDYVGPDTSLDYLKKAGITLDKREDGNLSLSMGGLTHGLSPMQMAAAYAPFANQGLYYEPITYTEIKDKDGNVVINKQKTASVKQKVNIVYDPETSFMMTDILKGVTSSSEGTAWYVKLKNSKGQSIPVAAKTGTTNDSTDRWFLAYTPTLVGAVWYGYDTQTTIVLPSGTRNPSAMIWLKVMEKVYAKRDQKEDFAPAPEGIVKKTVCIYSGKLATDLCAQDKRMVGSSGTIPLAGTREEYFIKGTEPKETCDMHVIAYVCKDSTESYTTSGKNSLKRPLLATENCPTESIQQKVLVRRKVPYFPQYSNDPYPQDWDHEIPTKYCEIHGAGAAPYSPGSGGLSGEQQYQDGNDGNSTADRKPGLDTGEGTGTDEEEIVEEETDEEADLLEDFFQELLD